MILAGQGFALGVTVAWITIPASAIFLAAYGAELLPVTYLGAAVAGIVVERRARGRVQAHCADLGCEACPRRALDLAPRVVGAAVAVGSELGVLRIARTGPAHGADRVRVRGGPGRDAARRPRPQGVLRARGRRLRAGLRGRRPRRPAAAGVARTDAEPLGRRRGLGGDVPVARGDDGAPIPRPTRRRGDHARCGGAPDRSGGGAQSLRPPHRGVPDVVRRGEPVARLQHARRRGAAVRRQRRARSLRERVLRHRLRHGHPVPARRRRLPAPPIRAALRTRGECDRRDGGARRDRRGRLVRGYRWPRSCSR